MGIAQRNKGIRSNRTSDRLRGSVRHSDSDKRGSEFERNRKVALIRDDYTCQRCYKSNHPSAPTDIILTVHHIVPVASGGSNRPSNLITLCNICHSRVPGKVNKQGAALLRSLSKRRT